jgi:hypothetical protein
VLTGHPFPVQRQARRANGKLNYEYAKARILSVCGVAFSPFVCLFWRQALAVFSFSP